MGEIGSIPCWLSLHENKAKFPVEHICVVAVTKYAHHSHVYVCMYVCPSLCMWCICWNSGYTTISSTLFLTWCQFEHGLPLQFSEHLHLALCCRFCANVSFFFKTTKASCLHHSQILSESRILETQHIKSHSVSVEGWLSWSPAFTRSQPLYTQILYIHTDFYFRISGSFRARFT